MTFNQLMEEFEFESMEGLEMIEIEDCNLCGGKKKDEWGNDCLLCSGTRKTITHIN